MNIKFVLLLLASLTITQASAQFSFFRSKKKETKVVAPYDSIDNITRANLPSLAGQKVMVLRGVISSDPTEAPTLFTKRPKRNGALNSAVVNPDKSLTPYRTAIGTIDGQEFDIIGVDSVSATELGKRISHFYLIIKNENYTTPHYLEVGCVEDLTKQGKIDIAEELTSDRFIISGYLDRLRNEYKGKKVVNQQENNRSQLSFDYIVRNINDNSPLASIPANQVWEIADVRPISNEAFSGIGYILTSKNIKNVYATDLDLNFTPYEDFVSNTKDVKNREKILTKKYGRTNARLILDGKVKKGFTRAMVEEALGKPTETISTKEKRTIIDTWTYPGLTLTFRNGRLSSANY